MAEELIINTGASKRKKYQSLLPQIEGLISGEQDLVANLANTVAALKYGMGFFWVGFYIVKNDELVLGPFQGPIACTRIKKGKGVCGACWERGETIVVPNVDEFPGHIACSSDSKSEIVVPAFKNGEVALILDVDSDKLNDFDETDKAYLEQLIHLLEQKL
ncbi:GAF domain-containing protein, involved in signal transduction [Fulvivirga imtechensis AK7]|uniref:GAF domain-containing protein, involved in signal transduction n=1 Tax=Fulvivirga imtechensis AK7 TaxID=1237149 RepID=L8JT96_9BACT|nr:GAF domain-containing protein [Fulvivirga imtechensis]ELR71443.1 GAF domain-containing protein, involved in signal transduction [Fulvivirga imtechensis AK7]